MSDKLTLSQLEQYLSKAAWILKGPAVVERLVTKIDAIVRVVRFDGWQTTSQGEREVQKSLRKALLKYKLHTDQVLFEWAYANIKEYY